MKKSKFNPKQKDATIEIFSLDSKRNYSNLRKKERQAIYSPRGDISVIIKEADKGSGTERTI